MPRLPRINPLKAPHPRKPVPRPSLQIPILMRKLISIARRNYHTALKGRKRHEASVGGFAEGEGALGAGVEERVGGVEGACVADGAGGEVRAGDVALREA